MTSFARQTMFCFLCLFILGFVDLSHGIRYRSRSKSNAGFDPEQVHISTASFDQMIVVWNTLNDTEDSYVHYGKGKVDLQASGARRKFVDGGPLQRVQYIHKVILTGLEPDTKYMYMVGSKKHGFSDLFSFKTWPEGDNWSPNLLIFGDLGYENPQSLPRMQAEVTQGMYDAVLHVGDIAYNMEDNNAELGDKFMRQIEPVASSLPYMTCPGNHEEAYNFSNYRYRFEMPGDEDKRMYYSYTMGPIRFISIATELIFFTQYGLVQIVNHYEWLKQELTKANKPENREKQPWVIVFGHRPMYCSNDNNDDCTHHESVIRVGIPFLHILGLEDMFYENSVDLAIWAHEHSYERLWPVYNRQVKNGSYEHPYTNPNAPVHIVTGSPGCKYHHDNFDNVTDDWSAFRTDDYGYTRMKVYNSSHLYVEQVSNDKDGAVVDKFMLIKDHHRAFPLDSRPVKPVGDPMKKLWNHFKNVMNMNIV